MQLHTNFIIIKCSKKTKKQPLLLVKLNKSVNIKERS